MTAPAFIGIDLGTSGCRILAIDRQKQILFEATRPFPPPHRGHNGESEQDPTLWWHAVQELLVELGEGLITHQPRAIAVDGTSATLLLCDTSGRPLSPGLMYDDNRAARFTRIIATKAPPESAVHSANSSLAKALYLAESLDDGQPKHLLHQADWITGSLCGKFGISDENNCLKLGYDSTTRSWPEWITGLGLPSEWLPKVVAPGTPIGTMNNELAEQCHLPQGIQLVAGTTDSTAAVLATGIHNPGQAVTSLGSTLVLKILSERPLFAPEYGIYSQRLGNLWLVGGASNSGGGVLANLFDPDEIEALTLQLIPEQPTGLNYYPLSKPGERFPINDPGLEPRFTFPPNNRQEFFQAILEGMSKIEQLGYQRLVELGTPMPTEIISIGGGAKNMGWRAIRERTIGIPVCIAEHQQAAFGSALLVLNSYNF